MPKNNRQSPLLFVKAPELRQEFHETLNTGINPEDLRISTKVKVWWKCAKGIDHIWKATPSDRFFKNSGCGICSGKVISYSRSIANTHPELSKSWHDELNGQLTPEKLSAGSDKKVWWKCSNSDLHDWEARVKDRVNKKSGCPYCAGKKVCAENSLSTTNPEIAAQWHPKLNGTNLPTEFTANSNKKIWWLCDKGADHIWESAIYTRKKSGCPMCSSGRMKKIVFSNSLQSTHPVLASEWDSELNKLLPSDVSYGYKGRVWWRCEKGPDHVWQASVNVRTTRYSSPNDRRGCPICSGNLVVPSTSLKATHKELIDEWAYDLNKKIKPDRVSHGSSAKVWWRCKNDPEHIWSAQISNRVRGSGCPYCTLTPQSKQELMILFELKFLFNEINPRGFKTNLDGKLWTIDIFIPSLRVGIEFDGNYWHKDKDKLDRLKTIELKKSGLQILRVRQFPLKKLHSSDIISELPFNAKDVVNNILTAVIQMSDLPDTKVHKIQDYIRQSQLMNQNKLENYISQKLRSKNK